METSQPIVNAVLAQVASKRVLLEEKERVLDAARQRLEEAQANVARLEDELLELKHFLDAAGVPEPVSQACRNLPLKVAMELVGGHRIRLVVLACADALFKEKGYFTVDELMAAIAAKNFALDVVKPRSRASQVLTQSAAYRFDDQRQAWTRNLGVAAFTDGVH